MEKQHVPMKGKRPVESGRALGISPSRREALLSVPEKSACSVSEPQRPEVVGGNPPRRWLGTTLPLNVEGDARRPEMEDEERDTAPGGDPPGREAPRLTVLTGGTAAARPVFPPGPRRCAACNEGPDPDRAWRGRAAAAPLGRPQ